MAQEGEGDEANLDDKKGDVQVDDVPNSVDNPSDIYGPSKSDLNDQDLKQEEAKSLGEKKIPDCEETPEKPAA